MEELSGAKVLVLGLGISGHSAAAFCADQGASVVAADERADVSGAGLPASVEVRVGRGFPDPAAFDLVVPSPGVPRDRYAARARRVWGDLELAWRALPVPVAAVTGTNGKSTTVRLLEAMLRTAGLRARAAGNVGEPALGLVGLPLDVAIFEVSSFQLEAVEAFRPRVAAWLNLSEDHLDRHRSLEAYAAAKERLFANQAEGDVAILNGDDARIREAARRIRAELWWFRRGQPVEHGGWVEDRTAVLRVGSPPRRLPIDSPQALLHPTNVLSALLAATALGADPVKAADALLSFRALPHRCQTVSTVAGITWVDDSKATNPDAACAALTTAPGPVVWIAGGRDKGLSYERLAEVARGRVRTALLIGEAAGILQAALESAVPCERVGTLEAAVRRARSLAEPGDVVLLSPACSSFDQFANFAERGERFRAAVAALEGGLEA